MHSQAIDCRGAIYRAQGAMNCGPTLALITGERQ